MRSQSQLSLRSFSSSETLVVRSSSVNPRSWYPFDLKVPSTVCRLSLNQLCHWCMVVSVGWSSKPLVSGVISPSRTPAMMSDSKCLYGASTSGSSRCREWHDSRVQISLRIRSHLISPSFPFMIRFTWSRAFKGCPHIGQMDFSLLSTKNMFFSVVGDLIICYNNQSFIPMVSAIQFFVERVSLGPLSFISHWQYIGLISDRQESQENVILG